VRQRARERERERESKSDRESERESMGESKGESRLRERENGPGPSLREPWPRGPDRARAGVIMGLDHCHHE
jgi:hypothetical protein